MPELHENQPKPSEFQIRIENGVGAPDQIVYSYVKNRLGRFARISAKNYGVVILPPWNTSEFTWSEIDQITQTVLVVEETIKKLSQEGLPITPANFNKHVSGVETDLRNSQ